MNTPRRCIVALPHPSTAVTCCSFSDTMVIPYDDGNELRVQQEAQLETN